MSEINFESSPIIATVRGKKYMDLALESDVGVIFDLSPNLMTDKETAQRAHEKGKLLFIHIDFAEGIGKDRAGIEYVKNIGVDGIISTRAALIRQASEIGLMTVQRYFVIDTHSVEVTLKSLDSSQADMLEIMPGVISKVITQLKKTVNIPIIAGGIIDNKTEIIEALKAGAAAVSTGKCELWNI